MNIPEIDARILFDPDHPQYKKCLEQVKVAAVETGFMTLSSTRVTRNDVLKVIDVYHQFFSLSEEQKAVYSMTSTDSNRGWGAPGAEQVDPTANPDYKEVFDCGLELPLDDPLTTQTYYAPNLWPAIPAEFSSVVSQYYNDAKCISLALLSAVARALGQPSEYFSEKFDKPMALLRGNYYPPRPAAASNKDFGIAPHTDYGCLTLLATDGSPGLEVQTRDHQWIPITVSPGTFIVNFGEMIQMWTADQVVATPHRVIGGNNERISIPFFFNPRFDVNVAPPESADVQLAGDYLSMRYDQTYIHRQQRNEVE